MLNFKSFPHINEASPHSAWIIIISPPSSHTLWQSTTLPHMITFTKGLVCSSIFQLYVVNVLFCLLLLVMGSLDYLDCICWDGGGLKKSTLFAGISCKESLGPWLRKRLYHMCTTWLGLREPTQVYLKKQTHKKRMFISSASKPFLLFLVFLQFHPSPVILSTNCNILQYSPSGKAIHAVLGGCGKQWQEANSIMPATCSITEGPWIQVRLLPPHATNIRTCNTAVPIK